MADLISHTNFDPEFYELYVKSSRVAGGGAPTVTTAIETGFSIGPSAEQTISASYSQASTSAVNTYQLEVRAAAWKIPARVTTTEVLTTNDLVAGTSSDVTTTTTTIVQGNNLVDTGTHTVPATVPGVTSYFMTVSHTIKIPIL